MYTNVKLDEADWYNLVGISFVNQYDSDNRLKTIIDSSHPNTSWVRSWEHVTYLWGSFDKVVEKKSRIFLNEIIMSYKPKYCVGFSGEGKIKPENGEYVLIIFIIGDEKL